MLKNTLYVLATALIISTSCQSKSSAQASRSASSLEVEARFIDSLEKAAQNIVQTFPGEVIGSIEFKVKATGDDLKTFAEGLVPWVNLEHPEKQLPNLVNGDNVVLPYQHVSLIIDYPLSHPDTSQLTGTVAGFTSKMLIQKISERYHKIYQEEEVAAKTKTVPEEKRTGIINRNLTDGPYGICCHDLGDLDLSSVEVYRTAEGKIVIMLGVES